MRPTVTLARLSAARGCIADIARLSNGVPLFPVERTMHLAAVAAAREAATPRIGWAALFIKAYALVARELPALRTWLALGPTGPCLATASESVATFAVNRTDSGADRLFLPRLPGPEHSSLVEIQRFITDCGTRPVEEIFKRQLELERLPGMLRRLVLRWNMWSPSRKRPRRLGTFSLSTLAGFRAINRFHPTLCSTSISYGPLEADGRCLVTLIADHRVVDGATVARALHWLEQALTTDMVAELNSLRGDAPVLPRAAA